MLYYLFENFRTGNQIVTGASNLIDAAAIAKRYDREITFIAPLADFQIKDMNAVKRA